MATSGRSGTPISRGHNMTTTKRRVAVIAAAGILTCALALGYELARLPSGAEMRAQMRRRYPAGVQWRPLAKISPELRQAVLAWEDPAFFHHGGVSYAYTASAAAVDMRERRFARGGSTITQQVAKNLFLAKEKTLRRKFDDAVLARRLEVALSKEEILEVYLNTADWGDDGSGTVYGAEAASQHYFEKTASELDWGEAALLASLLQNPRAYGPCVAPESAARGRRDRILRLLLKDGAIDASQSAAAQGSLIVRCPNAIVSATNSGPAHLQY